MDSLRRGASRAVPRARVIVRRRFGELIDRQLDLFEQDNADLFERLEDAEDEYRRAARADAEERFGDLQELLAEGGETLVGLRDTYAETLDDKAADEYAGASTSPCCAASRSSCSSSTTRGRGGTRGLAMPKWCSRGVRRRRRATGHTPRQRAERRGRSTRHSGSARSSRTALGPDQGLAAHDRPVPVVHLRGTSGSPGRTRPRAA